MSTNYNNHVVFEFEYANAICGCTLSLSVTAISAKAQKTKTIFFPTYFSFFLIYNYFWA